MAVYRNRRVSGTSLTLSVHFLQDFLFYLANAIAHRQDRIDNGKDPLGSGNSLFYAKDTFIQ